jgi:hypothetical protein
MKINGLYSRLVILILLILSGSVLWAADELVKGHYDLQNDWFVFEWEQRSGPVSTILDPSTNVDPSINAMAVFDQERQDYIYGYEVTNHGGRQFLQDILIRCLSTIYEPAAPSSEWYMNWRNYIKRTYGTG